MNNNFNTVCQYAVVRFMPFAETREFANVGIVIIAPKLGLRIAWTPILRVQDNRLRRYPL
jgi:hypothetical protein